MTYDKSTRSVSFNVVLSRLHLTALVDVEGEGIGWKHYQSHPLETTHGEIKIPNTDGEVRDIRLRLCLIANSSLCGDEVTAGFGKSNSYILKLFLYLLKSP